MKPITNSKKILMGNNKGQSLSIHTIVIAAISLLVLVILAILLINYLGGWGVECESLKGYTCTPDIYWCEEIGGLKAPTGKCPSTEVCCMPADFDNGFTKDFPRTGGDGQVYDPPIVRG